MPTVRTAERTLTAFLDGEDSPDISNPIHSTKVAAEYGFRGALVGGVTVYGWMAPAILELLGEPWLADGWADISFRRPVYPGDALTVRVTGGESEAELTLLNSDGERCIAGRVGLGRAPFADSLARPGRVGAEARPGSLPWLTLETAPAGEDLPPMAVALPLDAAEAYATNLQRDEAPRWHGEQALAHPGWIAARMTPLIKHSYDYGPAIHARSEIQHLAPARAGQTFTIAGRFVSAYEEKGHHYAVVDGLVLAEDGGAVAQIRHTVIFQVAKRPAREAQHGSPTAAR